jgi:hypothetical protein
MAMSISGVSDLSSMYSSIFGSSSSSQTTSSSNILGTYALIQSGVYKKELQAYYKSQETDKTSKTSTDSTSELVSIKSNANTLSSSLSTLNAKSLYASKGTDKDGNAVYGTDSIKSAMQKFVDGYNSYIKSAGSSSNSSILNSTVNLEKMTSVNSSMLSDVGITIGTDSTLSLDTSKLTSADVTKVQSLFQGYGSYGDMVKSSASSVYSLANSAAYTNNNASSYTYNGTYSLMGTTNGILDQYL